MNRSVVVPVRMTPEESDKITAWCNIQGYKKAAWIKRMALREIERMNGQGDGSAQARDMAATIGGQG